MQQLTRPSTIVQCKKRIALDSLRCASAACVGGVMFKKGSVMRIGFFVSLLVILNHPSAHASDFSVGENLLTKFIPSSSEWEAFEKKGSSSYSRMWQKKDVGFGDSYAVTTFSDKAITLTEFREYQDAPGRKGCDKFETTTIKESSSVPYPSVLWITSCSNSGKVFARMVQMAIRGKDSLYHLQKIWRSDAPAELVVEWQERISSASVCDTRSVESPCPEGFEKVE